MKSFFVIVCLLLAGALSACRSTAPIAPRTTPSSGDLDAPVLLVASSTAGQFVPVGTSGAAFFPTKATYRFSSRGGTAPTIHELKFSVLGPNTVASIQFGVGGTTAPVIGGVASLTGLNLVVPGGSGLMQDAFISYAGVGPDGLASGSDSSVALEYIRYSNSSGLSKTLCTARMGPCTDNLESAVRAPTMKLVGSVPTISMLPSTAALIPGVVEVAKITVSANATGDVILNALPVTVALANATLASGAVNGIVVVSDGNGNTLRTTNTPFSAAVAGGTSTITFTGGYQIPAGAIKTFKIFLDFATAGVGTSSATLRLGAVSRFIWTDAGKFYTATGADSVFFFNYPTNTVSISASR